jgi:two-component system, chemotaxis family, sensor kinase CheA
MAPDPYRYFRVEARELLDQCTQSVLELDKGAPGAPLVQRLLRLTHTLKGAARVVRQPEIADRAHAIEEVLAPFRDTEAQVTRDITGVIQSNLDEIGSRLQTLTPAEPTVQPAAKSLPSEEPLPIVSADVGEIDMVLDGLAETHALLTGLRDAARGMEKVQRLANVLLTRSAAPRPDTGAPERLFALADELHREAGGVERGLSATVDQMDRELYQVRASAERLRLVRAGSLFTVLERTALDAARALGKQVTFDATGGEIRLDSHVLGAVRNALIQLIRNAVAHGVERPDERRRAGKPETGRVGINISRRGKRVLFECTDDGGGLDLDAIRLVAMRRGVSGPEAEGTDAAMLLRMLLRGGITTTETATELSGRGIGLDIVREAVERLGGDVTVETRRGRGTVFRLAMPPSLEALDALIVDAGDSGTIAIPLDAVRGTVRATAQDILDSAPGTAMVHEGQAIAFASLSAVLDGRLPPAPRAWSVVILNGAGGLAAIGVDRLLGTSMLVVRPLPDQLRASPAVAGVAFDAGGNIQLVLDPDGIVAAARRGAPTQAEPRPARLPVLVIDDSLTTRMLEQSILESAGYEVDVAASAEDGLKAAHRRRYALFLVDVEMPGMDGFTFVETVGSDPALRDIPAILVTSRAAPEDLQRGRAVGAKGYIVKSRFDQTELLAMIRPLVG